MRIITFRLSAVCIAAGATLIACGGSGSNVEPPRTEVRPAAQINVLGSRADYVTDGDARLQVQFSPGVDASTAKVLVNGADQTSAFTRSGEGLEGVVTGLRLGDNTVVVSAPNSVSSRLNLKNHSRGGPVFSGEHSGPFHCATVTPRAASGNAPATLASGLTTDAVDAECNIASEYKYFYKTTTANCSLSNPDPNPPATPPANACFVRYDPAAPAPANMATTTTDWGQTVPYIVRVERGTMNRGIYEIATLVDPTKPTSSQHVWNRKVLFAFAGGGGQPRRQQRPSSNWTDDNALSRGYIVATNTMMDGALNNNRVLTTETTMMMKERIVDAYGAIRFAVGRGGSGGSIAQYTLASQQVGVLDGLLILQSLLDYDTSHTENWECSQLVDAYDGTEWKAEMASAGYTQAQINAKKAAINGHRNPYGCQAWYNSFGQGRYVGNNYQTRTIPGANRETGVTVLTVLPTPTNTCQLPPSVVYDPVSNPSGVRCGPWDWMSPVFGITDGGGNNTRDNTGIQYGLQALVSGAITPEEFVIINERVGGTARDGQVGPARALADRPALDTAYKVGLVTERNVGNVPIIDLRTYDDDGVHQQWRSYGMRARLVQANGHHDNQVIWRSVSASAAMNREALDEMDKWLTALKADTSNKPLPQKVVDTKPSTAFDFCYLSTDAGQTTKVTNQATCDADPVLRIGSSPRQVAGGPQTENILKCELKPINVADYAPAVLSAGQLSRLQAVFPGGVCDWSRPGVGRVPTGAIPFTFAAGPGGQSVGPAPTSTPVN